MFADSYNWGSFTLLIVGMEVAQMSNQQVLGLRSIVIFIAFLNTYMITVFPYIYAFSSKSDKTGCLD
jgi:hypothetical protein